MIQSDVSTNKHCSTFIAYCGKSQICQVIMLWCVPWGILQLQAQLPVHSLQSLLEQLIFSCIFRADKLLENSSIIPPLDQLTGSSLFRLCVQFQPFYDITGLSFPGLPTAHGHP